VFFVSTKPKPTEAAPPLVNLAEANSVGEVAF